MATTLHDIAARMRLAQIMMQRGRIESAILEIGTCLFLLESFGIRTDLSSLDELLPSIEKISGP